MNDEIIPINDRVNDFSFHLDSHPRTILSAGFGEGKSFFLNQCKNFLTDKIFITLYPVNYQVVSNEDIFNLIKRDILFQLFINDILEDTDNIPESFSISFFLSKPLNYISWVLEGIESLDYPEIAAFKAASKAINFFSKLKGSYNKFCKDVNKEEKELLKLWEKMESEGIYENDIITKLINKAISNWKEKNKNKQLILLIEDLDRLDPSHLFRIMNVLSAHIDYSYKYGTEIEHSSMIGNKFGFDNIVFVLDYDNLISIYRHFYGENTSFDGYMSKFSTKGYFRFSISDEKVKYFYKLASQICQMEMSVLQSIISSQILKDFSTRKICESLKDIDNQFRPIPDFTGFQIKKEYPLNIIRLIVILKRLGIDNTQIKTNILKEFNKKDTLKPYIIPFYFLMTGKELCEVSLGEKVGGYDLVYDFTKFNDSKEFKFDRMRYGGTFLEKTPSPSEIIEYIISLVGE